MVSLFAWPLMVLLLVVGWARSFWYLDQVRVTRSGTEWALWTDPGELVFSYRTDALFGDGVAVCSLANRERLLEEKMILGTYGMNGLAYRERWTPETLFRKATVRRVAMAPFWLVIACTVLIGVFAGP